MKKILLAVFFIAVGFVSAQAQSMSIRWYDDKGREFRVVAPSGEFSYGMISGDYISHDFKGRVTQVGDVFISYNYNGQVSSVGDVYISYDHKGRVTQVGGMFISYDYYGRITHTSGEVRRRRDYYGW